METESEQCYFTPEENEGAMWTPHGRDLQVESLEGANVWLLGEYSGNQGGCWYKLEVKKQDTV